MKSKLANSTHHPFCRACRVSIHPFAPLQGPILAVFSFKLQSVLQLIPFFVGSLLPHTQRPKNARNSRETGWFARTRAVGKVATVEANGEGRGYPAGARQWQLNFQKEKKNVQGRPPQQQKRGITIGVIHTGFLLFTLM